MVLNDKFELIYSGFYGYVFACTEDYLPKSIKCDPNYKNCTSYYHSKANVLVLNKDNRLYEKYKEILIYYLQMTDIQRAEILNEARKINMTFFDFINRVLRIQRKLKKKMKKPLKTM